MQAISTYINKQIYIKLLGALKFVLTKSLCLIQMVEVSRIMEPNKTLAKPTCLEENRCYMKNAVYSQQVLTLKGTALQYNLTLP